MEGLEGRFVRPRQVRYQAALRPDFIHSTTLAKRRHPRKSGGLIQRTCFSGKNRPTASKTPSHGINDLQSGLDPVHSRREVA